MAGLFQVLYGKGKGVFEEAKVLNGTDGEPLVIPHDDENEVVRGICTRPWAVDWDDDGDLDLLVGNFEGSFYLFRGEGEGQFQPGSEQILTGSDPLRIDGAHSDPMMVDWDGDGDLDLLSGSSNGGAQWAENIAEANEEPLFETFRQLVPGNPYREMGELVGVGDLKAANRNTRVWAADLNEDGKLDLLIGDEVTLTSMANGLSLPEYEKKLGDWQKASSAHHAIKVTAENEESHRDKSRELYFSRSEFLDEDRTGFVWLYLRK